MRIISGLFRLASQAFHAVTEWGTLSGPEYHHFKNVILSTSRGTSEIDRLIVSKFGLFVIEDKKYSGWIFGNADDPSWTATYFKSKHRFQNPLRQNYGHVKALEEVLRIPRSKIFPVVVFRGRCRFKTDVPEGVFLNGCASWIAQRREILFSDAEVERILGVLQEAETGFFATRRHAQSVRAKYSSTTICPKCGGGLVERIARAGPKPGSQFLGCLNYPGCRYTRSLSS